MPKDPPAHIGFAGVETFPDNFFSQEIWPLQKFFPDVKSVVVWSTLGGLVMAGAWYLSEPRGLGPETPMLGEPAAASQPSGVFPPADAYSESPAAAEASMVAFGKQAAEDGYRDPASMVSVAELAKALGAPTLVVLDVRPATRFALGHIPGARRLYRSDYSSSDAVPGMSRSHPELERLLRRLRVRGDSTVVLYGDGGPEPYRLWWTLKTAGGFDTRVLDGGLQAWKAAGHRVAGGHGLPIASGEVSIDGTAIASAEHWSDVSTFIAANPGTRLVDTRSEVEFSGGEKHPKAARAGHIPGAVHLDWA